MDNRYRALDAYLGRIIRIIEKMPASARIKHEIYAATSKNTAHGTDARAARRAVEKAYHTVRRS